MGIYDLCVMQIGDYVFFRDLSGGGTIMEMDKGLAFVVADDGRENWIALDQLESIGSDQSYVKTKAVLPTESEYHSDDWGIGARVSYLNEAGGGEVIEEGEKGYLVLDEDGFERWFTKSALVLVSPAISQEMAESDTMNKDSSTRVYSPRKVESNILEVDLHMTELLEFDSHLTDHEKLLHQLKVAKHQVDKARKGHYKKVILIHGVGKGVLREKIHELLDGMERVEYYDASMQKYGVGATEVVFR